LFARLLPFRTFPVRLAAPLSGYLVEANLEEELMKVLVSRGDGGGPLWPEQVEAATLIGNVQMFFAPRPSPHVREGDELLLREAGGSQRRACVEGIMGEGTSFVVCLLGPAPCPVPLGR
jgi:hypothetical protein